MKNLLPLKILFSRMIVGLILSFGIATPASNKSITTPRTKQKILRISPAKLVDKVHKKIQANPKMTATEVTAFANSVLEQHGYDYTFDVCEFISKPISDMNEKDATFLYRSFLKRVDGAKQLIQFSSGNSAACGECFADFPVRKLSSSEFHLQLDGKVQKFTRPKEFILDQMDLMDSTMKKVIRSWDVPTQDYPSAISEDGKTLFLRVGFTEKDRERGIKVTSTIGKKMKQEFPYSLLAISANEIKFVEAKPILTQQTIEEISQTQNSYLSFRRFRVGKKNMIVRYSAPCT